MVEVRERVLKQYGKLCQDKEINVHTNQANLTVHTLTLHRHSNDDINIAHASI